METLILLIILLCLFIPFKIKTKIIIDAPQKEVMNRLVEFENYSKWNPFILSVQGKLKLHSTLHVTLNMGKHEMHISPKVIDIQDDMFCWKGVLGMIYIFDGVHCFKAEEISQNKTLFMHVEYFQGILVWFMFPMLLKTKKHFELMNEALKEGVEFSNQRI